MCSLFLWLLLKGSVSNPPPIPLSLPLLTHSPFLHVRYRFVLAYRCRPEVNLCLIGTVHLVFETVSATCLELTHLTKVVGQLAPPPCRLPRQWDWLYVLTIIISGCFTWFLGLKPRLPCNATAQVPIQYSDSLSCLDSPLFSFSATP